MSGDTRDWTVIDGIGSLVTNDPELGDGQLGLISNAAVVVGEDMIQWVGPSRSLPDGIAGDMCDVGGSAVLPGFVDSHSHLVFGGDRAEEFSARMTGKPYAAGGIRTTIAATRAASDQALAANASRLAREAHRQGTTYLEVKSGYGQTVHDERRSLRIAAGVTDEVTLLAAHVTPPEFEGRQDDYVSTVIEQMIPACSPFAKWIDVFCERGAFDVDQSRAILAAGSNSGLTPRVHGNQLSFGGGVALAVELGAASVDHVTYTRPADVDALAGSSTVATLLPGADFCTRNAYPDARSLLDAGVTVALAADCNPGTSYTTSMPFCIALAVRDLLMSPDEAVWAATAGGAAALRRKDIGVVRPGARADLIVLDAPSHLHLAYRPGVPLVASVFIGGERLW